jgi:FixJ family two-component response regulator
MIYIVDDDSTIRESLATLLETYGFGLSLYASGDDFLAGYPYDDTGCVVLDINMPGISGVNVLERLRSRGCRVPVIAITGRGDPGLKDQLIQMGASAVFDKPVDDEDLVKAIDTAFPA